MHDLKSPKARDWQTQGAYLKFGDRSVYYQQRGKGPTVFLLHGFPTSSFDWGPVMDQLEAQHHLVTLDFLGFGLSDKPEAFSYSLFVQADLVEHLAKHLGITSAAIVSHDMGTSVHTELLARELERRLSFTIAQSIFTNGSMLQWMAHITPFQQMVAANATIPQALELCRGPFETLYLPTLKSLMTIPSALTDDDEAAMNELLLLQSGQLRLPAIAGYMRERYIHADRWLGAIEKSSAPVTFLWADSDPIAHRAMAQEHLRRAPNATLRELAGLGHFLMLEDPGRVASSLKDLLA